MLVDPRCKDQTQCPVLDGNYNHLSELGWSALTSAVSFGSFGHGLCFASGEIKIQKEIKVLS